METLESEVKGQCKHLTTREHAQIINDYQSVSDEEAPEWAENGPDGKRLYYDHPSYDVLWKTLVELDRPIYMHPRLHHGDFYKKRPWVSKVERRAR